MAATDPTANIRKYPKGPNFGLIVVLSAIAIVILLALGVLFLRTGVGRKTDPVKPHPEPNSRLLTPGQLRMPQVRPWTAC